MDTMFYNYYNAIMRNTGFDHKINRFLHLSIPTANHNHNIIEFGCGTGVTGLTLLQIFPNANLLCTDIENHFLERLDKNIEKLNVNGSRINVGVSDISSPNMVTLESGEKLIHDKEEFDFICAGANIGYGESPEKSIKQLYQMLRPGGVILNLEMNTKFWGKSISALYNYDVIHVDTFTQWADNLGAEISVTKVPVRFFPLNLTRTFIQIRKPKINS